MRFTMLPHVLKAHNLCRSPPMEISREMEKEKEIGAFGTVCAVDSSVFIAIEVAVIRMRGPSC